MPWLILALAQKPRTTTGRTTRRNGGNVIRRSHADKQDSRNALVTSTSEYPPKPRCGRIWKEAQVVNYLCKHRAANNRHFRWRLSQCTLHVDFRQVGSRIHAIPVEGMGVGLLLCLGFWLVAFIFSYRTYTGILWSRSFRAREAVLKELGLRPTKITVYRFVGFFHPYW